MTIIWQFISSVILAFKSHITFQFIVNKITVTDTFMKILESGWRPSNVPSTYHHHSFIVKGRRGSFWVCTDPRALFTYIVLCVSIKITLVKTSGFFFGKFLQSIRKILWVFRFISALFVKFLGENCIFPPGNLVWSMYKILDFKPNKNFILENSRNSLSKSMKKADSIGKNIYLKIYQKFHEFSTKQISLELRNKIPEIFN